MTFKGYCLLEEEQSEVYEKAAIINELTMLNYGELEALDGTGMNESEINEMIKPAIQKLIDKALTIKPGANKMIAKANDVRSFGLIDYAKSFIGGTGKIIIAAAKGDGKKVKEIAKTLEKRDMLDFILKLDQATLGIIDGYLDKIDAWTGWDLAGSVKQTLLGANAAILDFHKAMRKAKGSISRILSGDDLTSVTNTLDQIDKSIA